MSNHVDDPLFLPKLASSDLISTGFVIVEQSGRKNRVPLSALMTYAAAQAVAAKVKAKVVDGAAAGDVTVAGMLATSTLALVARFDIDTGAVVDVDDLTSEFAAAAGKINNAEGSSTSGDKLLVVWVDA